MFDRNELINTGLPLRKDLLRFFKTKDELLIFDIGSCEGEDAIRYSRLFPNARVFAFEPLPKNQEMIMANISRHQAANVRLFKMALSESEGMQDFYVSSGEPFGTKPSGEWDYGNKSSSLLPPGEVLETVKWLKFESKIEVYTNTLSNVITAEGLKIIDFVHMDVQGAELDVLRGAGDHLQNISLIWLEIAETPLYSGQPLRQDVEKFMITNSFKLLKTQLENGVGDQLYMNTRHFTDRSFWGLTRYRRHNFSI